MFKKVRLNSCSELRSWHAGNLNAINHLHVDHTTVLSSRPMCILIAGYLDFPHGMLKHLFSLNFPPDGKIRGLDTACIL